MATSRMTSTICESGAERGRYFRPVERFVHHGAPIGFRDLCRAAVPTTTRYLVLDLDRTLHLARNMGELLGWETAAYHSYGAAHLEEVEEQRGAGRFWFAPSQPLGMAKYVYRGARGWAYPGMFYLIWGRMAGAYRATQRLRARRYGSDAYLYVQTLPNLALLHDLAGMSLDEARELSGRVFRRQVEDQVIDASDIAWLRARCPDARIILSSASPQPAVEAAAHELGITDALFTEVEIVDGRLSAPYHTSAAFLRDRHPARICPPSAYRVNSGRDKIDHLVARYPDILDSETVGITDTWHGDDHCWAHHFHRVIDINSIDPFPPLVSVESPIREIHSAQVLTVAERRARANGDTAFRSKRRERLLPEHACALDAGEIEQRLGESKAVAERIAGRYDRLRSDLAPRIRAHDARIDACLSAIEDVVSAYNVGTAVERRALLRSLARLTRKQESLRRDGARLNRPLSDLGLDLAHALEHTRRLVVTDEPDALWTETFPPATTAQC